MEQAIAPDLRYQEIALQLRIKETGEVVGPGGAGTWWGGVWDHWMQDWTGEAPEWAQILPCSRNQFGFLLDEHTRVAAKGGRGGGKTEGLVLRIIVNLLVYAGYPGQVVAPTYKQAMVSWGKLLKKLPTKWILPGLDGIKKSDRNIVTVMASDVTYCSADNPETLRGPDYAWAILDEEKDLTDATQDIILPGVRVGPTPRVWSAGTPEMGHYQERWEKMKGDPDLYGCHSMPGPENPFVAQWVWDNCKAQMDERRYRQEVLGEFVRTDTSALVFYAFDRDIHEQSWPPMQFTDVTRQVTKKKCGAARDFIVGVDYNWNSPNVGVVYKVADIPDPGQDMAQPVMRGGSMIQSVQKLIRVWYVVDVVQEKRTAAELGKALKRKGYANALVIDDASGRYQKRNWKQTASSFMSHEGFLVRHPTKNPLVMRSVDDVQVLLAPADGSLPRWYCTPACEALMHAMEELVYLKTGKVDKSLGVDHLCDGMRYVISFFEPAKRITTDTYMRGILAA